MTFESLGTTVTTILVVIGGLIVIMNFIDKVRAWRKPSVDKDMSVEERLEKHDTMLAINEKRLNAGDASNRALLACTAALIDHSIYGNNMEELKKRRSELNKYLIER